MDLPYIWEAPAVLPYEGRAFETTCPKALAKGAAEDSWRRDPGGSQNVPAKRSGGTTKCVHEGAPEGGPEGAPEGAPEEIRIHLFGKEIDFFS